MALLRQGCRSKQSTADSASRTVEPQARHPQWVTDKAHPTEYFLQRKSYVYGGVGLIVGGIGQVKWGDGESTQDSCQEEQN
jgi:hypothetical protein